MVRNYSSTFGGDRHFGSRDMVLLVIKGQDFSCRCLNSLLLLISKAHDMPCSHTKFQDVDNNLPVYSRKDFQTWSCMCTRVTDKNCLKSFCQSVQNKG